MTQVTAYDSTQVAGSDLQRRAMPPLGATIGRYAVTGALGSGGMGLVVSALDVELGRTVAIKLLHAAAAETSTAGARLEREAQAMAKLSHPNVVTVYEVGKLDGQPFIAMELVEGQTLRGWLQERRPAWREIITTFVAAGRGLAAAHAVGLIHRDFKPDNVLMGSDGRPRVSDFGLVTSRSSDLPGGAELGLSPMTRTAFGSVLGTPAYMAPEQWEGLDVGVGVDQFAFAVALWEALWEARPFEGTTIAELRERVLDGEVRPLASRRGVPRRIERALRRALSHRPEDRWPELSALLGELERHARDRRAAFAVGALGLAAAAIVGGLASRGASHAVESPCANAAAALDRTWNPERREAVGAAFGKLAIPFAGDAWRDAATTLDAWAASYRTIQLQACELDRASSEAPEVAGAPISLARNECLQGRLTELDALLTTVATPDDTIAHYVQSAAHALTRPEACLTASSDPRSTAIDLPIGDALDRSRRKIARASSLRTLGKPAEAVEIATQAASDADLVGWPQLVAEAQLELGLGYQATQMTDAAGMAHQRAAWNADTSHDDALRFDATLGLVDASIGKSEYQEAGRQLETARMISNRLRHDRGRAARVIAQDSLLAYWRGHYGDCISYGKRAIAAIEQAFGPVHITGVRVRTNLARCLSKLDRIDEEAVPLRDALAIADATAGRQHPLTAEVLSNLGTLSRQLDKVDEALGYFRESLAIRELIFGPDNPEVASVLHNIGNALRELGKYDEATASIERAIAIWQRAWGSDSPAIAMGATVLGHIAMERHDPRKAEIEYGRALEIRRKKRPAGHEEISKSVANLGRALLALADPRCVALFEEAAAGYDKNPDADPSARAEARFLLGRALVELKRDVPRGRALIEAACPEIKGPSWHEAADACRAYPR